jgi:hypothetical protein
MDVKSWLAFPGEYSPSEITGGVFDPTAKPLLD